MNSRCKTVEVETSENPSHPGKQAACCWSMVEEQTAMKWRNP